MQPMESAPESGRVVLALFRDDAFPKESRFVGWNGLWVPLQHQGRTASDFDLGWAIAGPAGQGGFRPEQFVGFVDPEAMPSRVTV